MKKNLKIILKNPLTIWFSWLIHFLIIKNKYPTVEIYYNAFARNTSLGRYVTINDNTTLLNCSIGDFTYFAGSCVFANTVVGKFCSIGPGVRCGPGDHPSQKFVSTHPIFYSVERQAQLTFADRSYVDENLPIKIGNDVWIGAHSVVLNGIQIGDGPIVAAGAIVTKDVPDYAIVGGIPAEVIKYRFEPEEIISLLQFKWWDKGELWLKDNWKKFHSIKVFLQSNL